MEKLICNKCNSQNTYTQQKGSQTGVYCGNCGKWIKWMSKNELNLLNQSKIRGFTKEEADSYYNAVDKLFEPIGDGKIKEELRNFVEFLDNKIDSELCRTPLGQEDAMVKCAVALAHERDKNALLNILDGKKWDDNN